MMPAVIRQPHIDCRDLCRAYLGAAATDAECNYAWFFIADAYEDQLADFAQSNRDPLAALRRHRAKCLADARPAETANSAVTLRMIYKRSL